MNLKGKRLIDSYHFSESKDEYKKRLYESINPSEMETGKTESLKNRLNEYAKEVYGTEKIDSKIMEGRIYFKSGVGYISSKNSEFGRIDVYHYGGNEEEAFLNATIELEIEINKRKQPNNKRRK